MKRKHLNRKKSRKNFTRGATNIKAKNYKSGPMRGGIRL